MIRLKNKLVPVPVLACQHHMPCRNGQRPSSLSHWEKSWNIWVKLDALGGKIINFGIAPPSWKSCKGWVRWTAKNLVVQSTKMLVGNMKYTTMQNRTSGTCRNCSMSHSEMLRATMLWSNSTSQVPALTRRTRPTRNVTSTAGIPCGTSASTRFTTPVSPSEKAGNCRPGKTWSLHVVAGFPKAWGWNLKRAPYDWEIPGRMATSYYLWYLFINSL